MWLQVRRLCILSFFSIVILCISSPAISQSPQDALKQYITDLQKNPNDTSLRERIIKTVLNIKTAPPLPEETRKFMARGKAALKGAKEEKDFSEAAEEFKKAVLSAPWLAEGYYNLGIVQDKAGQHAAAIESLRLYLMAAPAANDADAVKELIYEIEYRKEKLSKEKSPEAIAAKKQKEYEEWLKKLDGAQWRIDNADTSMCLERYIEVRGREIREGSIVLRPSAVCHMNPYLGESWTNYRGTIVDNRIFFMSDEDGTFRGTISEDGVDIIEEYTPKTSGPVEKPFKNSFTRVSNPKYRLP